LKKEQLSDGFFNDTKKVSKVGREVKFCEYKLEKAKHLQTEIDNCFASIELLEEIDDEGIFDELVSTISSLEKEIENAKLETLLSGKYDNYNAILTLHAGAGGTEAQDWADMLFRMYNMYAEKNGFKVKVLDSLDGDEAGIKSISFLISGEYAYGYLKGEQGVHRLVRISPFDAGGRRHTSFASISVTPEFNKDIDIEIKESDLKIDVYHSSGAGGQSVNTSNSAVRITHLPTNTVVTCQNERSQMKNKDKAMKILRIKLYDEMQSKKDAAVGSERKSKIGSGDRSEKIRTYNYPQNRVTDHRINFSIMELDRVMNGNLEPIIDALITEDLKRKLAGEE